MKRDGFQCQHIKRQIDFVDLVVKPMGQQSNMNSRHAIQTVDDL